MPESVCRGEVAFGRGRLSHRGPGAPGSTSPLGRRGLGSTTHAGRPSQQPAHQHPRTTAGPGGGAGQGSLPGAAPAPSFLPTWAHLPSGASSPGGGGGPYSSPISGGRFTRWAARPPSTCCWPILTPVRGWGAAGTGDRDAVGRRRPLGLPRPPPSLHPKPGPSASPQNCLRQFLSGGVCCQRLAAGDPRRPGGPAGSPSLPTRAPSPSPGPPPRGPRPAPGRGRRGGQCPGSGRLPRPPECPCSAAAPGPASGTKRREAPGGRSGRTGKRGRAGGAKSAGARRSRTKS